MINAAGSQPCSPAKRRREAGKNILHWSTFTLCRLSGLLLSLSWTGSLLLCADRITKPSLVVPSLLKTSWSAIHSASPPTQPMFVGVSLFPLPRYPMFWQNYLPHLAWPGLCAHPSWGLLCPVSVKYVPCPFHSFLIFSEFLLHTSTGLPLPHLQTLPQPKPSQVCQWGASFTLLEMFFLPLYIRQES